MREENMSQKLKQRRHSDHFISLPKCLYFFTSVFQEDIISALILQGYTWKSAFVPVPV